MKFAENFFAKKVAFISAGIALLMFVDLYEDYRDGVPYSHLLVEFAIFSASSWIFLYVLGQWYLGRRAQSQLQESLENLKLAKAKLRAEMNSHLLGLGSVIENPFKEWNFTLAEREVGLLLLKGISQKEIASLRGCAEKTVHSQVQSLYRKSGLRSRSEFSAFFLEDLLNPIQLPENSV